MRLRRQIPYTLAMEILLTGKHLTADEALRIGLIGRVVPDGQALAEARRVAEQIAENGPLAVQAIKRSVQETEGLPEKRGARRGARDRLAHLRHRGRRRRARAPSSRSASRIQGR